MRILLSGAAVAALALGSMSSALAAQCTMMGGGMMGHGMPHCSKKAGPVVWFMPPRNAYVLKGWALYGQGMGMYVCRATAVARGGHLVNFNRGETRPQHGAMGGSHAMPGTMTMAPRPMTSPGSMTSPMPRTTTGPGLPNSTNAAPGSQGSPMPTSGNSASGNQGNTGAPGAGGQVPNNPASTSNSNPNPSSPSPSPKPHP